MAAGAPAQLLTAGRRPLDASMPFETTVDIEAPASAVHEVMMDLEEWSDWTASIRRIRRLDPGTVTAGTRVRVEQPRLPTTVWTVTEVREDGGFTWVARSPGAVVTADHAVRATGPGRCRVTLRIEHRGWLGRLVGLLTRGITERYMALEAEGLKRRSEEQGPGSGA